MTKTDTPTNGRNHQGHFTQGNPGGPGNPYARQVAKLRKKVLQVIGEDQMEEIILELFQLATKGNLQAIKVLLQYTLGKPAEAQNPDLVDVEEWDQMKTASEKVFQADRVVGTPELETFLRMARVTRPSIGQEMTKKFVGKLQNDLEAEQAKPKKNKKGKKKAPAATNGSNGHRKEPRAASVVENDGIRLENLAEEMAIIDMMLAEGGQLGEEDLVRLTNRIPEEARASASVTKSTQPEEERLTNRISEEARASASVTKNTQPEGERLTNRFSEGQAKEERLTNRFSEGQPRKQRVSNGKSSTGRRKPTQNEQKMDLKTLRRLRSLK